VADRSLWEDPPPRRFGTARPATPPPEPRPEFEPPEEPAAPDLARPAIGVAAGLVVLATLLGISGDWFSTGPGISYLAAWSGAVLVVTAAMLVAATLRMLLTGRDASLAVGIAALVWAGQVAALLTGLGEEAAEVGGGAVGAAVGLPAALALAFDGLATGRTEVVPRRVLAAVGITLGAILAVALTVLPLGEQQVNITIIR